MNYIEDIFRYLEDHQLGTIDEIDSYSNGEFIVKIKSKRKLGEIKREIIRLLNFSASNNSAKDCDRSWSSSTKSMFFICFLSA